MNNHIGFIYDWEADQKACEQDQSKIFFSIFQNIPNISLHQSTSSSWPQTRIFKWESQNNFLPLLSLLKLVVQLFLTSIRFKPFIKTFQNELGRHLCRQRWKFALDSSWRPLLVVCGHNSSQRTAVSKLWIYFYTVSYALSVHEPKSNLGSGRLRPREFEMPTLSGWIYILNIIMHETTTEIKISETCYIFLKAPHPSQRHKNTHEYDFLIERAELMCKCQNFPKDLACHVSPKLLSLRWDEVRLWTTSRNIRNGRKGGITFASSDFPQRHSLGDWCVWSKKSNDF